MKKLAAIALILAVSLLSRSVTASDDTGWLAFGDLRGKLEPCGCNPDTDLGGVRRLGVMIAQERLYHKDLFLFSLGANLTPEGTDPIAENYILEALAVLKVTAALVGEGEYRYLSQPNRKTGSTPWVLTNLKTKIDDIAPSVQKNGIRVFGFLEHPKLMGVQEFLREMKAQMKKSETNYLLFSGTDLTLNEIIKTGIFDTIITSNKIPLSETGAFSEEREFPENLFRKDGVLMTPLGSGGVLRGGVLSSSSLPRSKSLLEEFDSSRTSSTKIAELKPSILSNNFVSWLSKEYERDSILDPLLKKYKKLRDEEFDRLVKWKKKNTNQSTAFAGAEACKACHPGAYAIWKKSAHSRAFETLVNKRQEKNSECVGCHVVGFSASGGFISNAETPHLAGVQCENCHGARIQHVKDPMVSSQNKADLEGCKSCHHRPHSSFFVPKDRWSKITHGNKLK